MAPPAAQRPHHPLLDKSESCGEYLQRQKALRQEGWNGESIADSATNHFQYLDAHLSPTAQVSCSINGGNSGNVFQFFEADSVAFPQSPHPSDFSGLSDILTESEGGRPVLLTFAPLEQDVVEKSYESELVRTDFLDIQPETVDTGGSVFIKGLENKMFFCYQNCVVQMICASEYLRPKFLDHLDAMNGGLHSVKYSNGTHRFASPSCCADEKCLLCVLGWVVVNHRFCVYEAGSTRSNTTAPLNSWIHDFRALSSNLGYDGASQQDACEYLMEIINAMSALGNPSEPIVDVLTGSYPSVVHCPKCNNQSVTGQELRMLQLHYPPTAIDSSPAIEDLIDTFFGAERVDSACDTCLYKSSDSSFLKIVRVNRAPRFLILSVARYNDLDSPKLMGPLKIKEYLALASDFGPVAYALKAVICHAGNSKDSGHYTCFVRKPGHIWVSCDDHSIEEVSFKEIKRLYYTQPVLLGYEKDCR